MPAKKKKNRRKWIVLGVIVIAVAGVFAAAFFRKKDEVISVQTDKVQRRDLTELVVANGRVQPVLQVKISPEVSGEIIELRVKEAQQVKKGDLLLRIKPDFYIANRNSAEANYKSSLSDQVTSEANLAKAESEFRRNDELFKRGLISESVYTDIKTSFEIAKANVQSSMHRVEMAKASMARSEEELLKTTIVSPLDGTVSQLNSKLGERVVGTVQQAGTDVMTIVDLNEMEARVDIGEMDVVLIQLGQKARLEVDAFRDRKFTGTVTEIANASKNAGAMGGGGQNQDATRFEVKIHVDEAAPFRPGMSVTAQIETRYRTNVLTVPIASIGTRLPKVDPAAASTNAIQLASATNMPVAALPSDHSRTNGPSGDRPSKAIEVVFRVEGDLARQQPVKLGISDNNYYEIEEGLTEGQEIISGGFLAISRLLEDGKKIVRGGPGVPGSPVKPATP